MHKPTIKIMLLALVLAVLFPPVSYNNTSEVGASRVTGETPDRYTTIRPVWDIEGPGSMMHEHINAPYLIAELLAIGLVGFGLAYVVGDRE